MDSETAARIAKAASVRHMQRAAYGAGLDASEVDVDKHYLRFTEWYNSKIPTHYLMLVTGVRYRKGHHA
jgi:hypothetical protein